MDEMNPELAKKGKVLIGGWSISRASTAWVCPPVLTTAVRDRPGPEPLCQREAFLFLAGADARHEDQRRQGIVLSTKNARPTGRGKPLKNGGHDPFPIATLRWGRFFTAGCVPGWTSPRRPTPPVAHKLARMGVFHAEHAARGLRRPGDSSVTRTQQRQRSIAAPQNVGAAQAGVPHWNSVPATTVRATTPNSFVS